MRTPLLRGHGLAVALVMSGGCALLVLGGMRLRSSWSSSSSSSVAAHAGGSNHNNDNIHVCQLSSPQHHPVCHPGKPFDPAKYDEIYMLHMRKGGGTTMRVYLKRVAEVHNLTLRFSEGEPDTTTTDWTRTFRITNLRQPIQRAISHYKYDQRWSCNSRDVDSLTSKKGKFVPTKDNIQMTFEDFLHVADRRTPTRRHPKRLWTCATNCFVRWATGHAAYIDVENDAKSASRLLNDAYQALCQYDLIVNTDWLAKGTYRRKIEKYFGVDGLYNATQKASDLLFCSKESRAANARVPLVIRNETQEELEAANRIDLELYRRFTDCGIAAENSEPGMQSLLSHKTSI